MGKINILALSSGDVDLITLGVIKRINSGVKNFLITENHPIINYLKDNKIPYKSYDYLFEKEEELEKVHNTIVEDLIKKSEEYKEINYLVLGNPLFSEITVKMLLEKENEDLKIELIGDISFEESILQLLKRNSIKRFKIVDGTVFSMKDVDINIDYIIIQVYNNRATSKIKSILSEVYGDDYIVYVIKNPSIKGKEQVYKIPLHKLSGYNGKDSLISIYVPKMDKINNKVYDINDNIDLTEILRSEKGCPWDREQTHESIRENVIEEAYEVVDAIDNKDIDNLVEELGDLLFQVLFHCQIGREKGKFNIYDVTTALSRKLIFRHPHVFSEKKVEKSDEVVYNWNKLKYKNRNINTYTDILKDIPKLPALMRSYKVQERAGQIGFDWDNVNGALEKVKEEYFEVIKSINSIKGGDVGKVEEELGDLLFSVVNVCRFMKVNPEVALNKTVNKFINRFEFMEKMSNRIGKSLKDMTLEEMDKLWEEAKLHKY